MPDYFESAPAKVNLALHVTGRRANGYHELESLVVFVRVADELRAASAEKDRLIVKGPFANGLTNGQSNLVLKALSAFRATWPDALPDGVDIELTKNLPVAAGIGGGSADAAAALRLMVQMSRVAIDQNQLLDLAASLGADVPVCLLSVPTIMAGIGDQLELLADFPAFHLVLINPLTPVATGDIFRRMARADYPGLPPLNQPLSSAALMAMWLEETRNDLEEPAIALLPKIAEIIATLKGTHGCVCARMSGSGATVFGLYGSAGEAQVAAEDLRRQWSDYWIAATALEPV